MSEDYVDPQYEPQRFAVSWLRAYPTSLMPDEFFGADGRPSVALADKISDLPVLDVAEGDHSFYDVQTTTDRHIVRVRLGGLSFGPCADEELDWKAATHVQLLFHRVGFVVIRLTVSSEGSHDWRPSASELRRLSGAVFSEQDFCWSFECESGEHEIETDVRGAMDAIFFDLHERAKGREPNMGRGIELVEGGWDGRFRRFNELAEQGELLSPYPVVFGSHFEMLPNGVEDQQGLAHFVLLGDVSRAGVQSTGPAAVPDPDERPWFVGENVSVVLFDPVDKWSDELSSFTSTHIQILEFLTLQRGGLRSVQRSTQRVITEDLSVSRRQLANWNRVIAALTDDYVLHDQVARSLEPLQRHLQDEEDLRDPAELHAQVTSNLQSFQAGLDASTDRAGIMLSLLFGVVAATAVAPLLNRILILVLGLNVTSSEFDDKYLTLSVVSEIALIVITALFSLWLFRRISSGRSVSR